MSIKISIIEDQKEIREMLSILVKGSEGFLFLDAFENAEDAIATIPNRKPDVVLVDIHLPQQSGIDCVLKLKQNCPEIQFIMCTSLEDSETIFAALKAGANGYITKSTSPAKLLEAIIDVYNGGSPMSAQIARKVVGAFQQTHSTNKAILETLSKREQEILTLLSKGFRYKEIADKLFLSIETVRTHVRNIYEKLQVNSRTDAINKAFREQP
ncbi:MAG: response regulator transcription factor [Bacteroidota bacterium]|nr:response regulator transcription factor [Bacteroidota bacterium]